MIRNLLLVFAVLAGMPLVAAEKAAPIRGDWTPQQVAEGVYVIHGPIGVPLPENQGFMNNPAFVLTSVGVVVVDPGGSVQTGEMLLQEIGKVTDQAVVAVFNTHVHGDHWLGNQAIHERYPDAVIYAHPKMIARVAQGAGTEWINMAMRMTEGAIAGTRVVNAQNKVVDADEIRVGDQLFRIYNNGFAHTDNDIMIYAVDRGVMFLGDNATTNRIVRQEHGSVQGNIEALQKAIDSGASMFVPGHGPSGEQAAALYKNYLSVVYETVKQYYNEGLSDYEIKPHVEPLLSDYKDWSDFDRILGQHISAAYLEVEAADF
ncbi:MAG: MBL fold metallo-hydrolase [Chromatiales bacterium]|jgi:glyoxylase-like metal-dependent hydrolase (beta-lactamase superfamily II)